MKNDTTSKTLTASLPSLADILYARISDPQNLSTWHTSFSGYPVRFIRNDPSLAIDLVLQLSEDVEMTQAIRLHRNGMGCEMIWTIIKSEGVTDSIFNEQLRWAATALQNLRKIQPVAGIGDSEIEPNSKSPMPDPSPSEPATGKKLFVGNLSYDWTDDQLRAHFAESGTVAVAEVARFRGRGGRSRGFGFVEMASEAEAQTAIEKFHGVLAGGRQIIVRLAKSQENHAKPAAPPAQPKPERARRPHHPPRAAPRTHAPRRSGPSRSRTPAADHSYPEQDISNKSGYEIFPRRPK